MINHKIVLNNLQQGTYNFFVKVYGGRVKGHEEDIKEIIVTASSLIEDMDKNGDIGNFITEEYKDCLKNVEILYDILDIVKKDRNMLKDKTVIYFVLIMYVHQCEALRFLFKGFIAKNIKAICLPFEKAQDWFDKKERKMIRLEEIKGILNTMEKSEDSTTLQDFITAFHSKKYKIQSRILFKKRIMPPLRNAVAHNRLKIDEGKEVVQYYDNKKLVTIKFADVIGLYDTIMMIYYAIVIELTDLSSKKEIRGSYDI